MKLISKLIILFLLFSMLPLGVAAYFVYQGALVSERQEVAHSLQTVNLLKEAELRRWFDIQLNTLEMLAQQPLVREYSRILANSEPGNMAYDWVVQRLLKDQFEPALNLSDGILTLSFLHPYDASIMVSTNPYLINKAHQPDQNFYLKGKSGTYLDAPVYDDLHNEIVLHASTPVFDPQGELSGVLVAQLDVAKMSQIISEHSLLMDSEDSYLVNQEYLFVTPSRLDKEAAYYSFPVDSQGVKDCLEGNSGWDTYLDYRGATVIGAYQWLPDLGLCQVMEVDEAEALASIYAQTEYYRNFGLLIILGILFLAIILAYMISRPLERVLTGTQQVAIGNLDHRIEIRSNDEIGELAQSFNQMSASLKELYGEAQYKSRLLASLGQTAQRVQRAADEQEIYSIIGEELQELGYISLVFKFSPDHKQLTIPHLNIDKTIQRIAERLTGLTPQSYRLTLEEESLFYQISETNQTRLFSTSDELIKAALTSELRQTLSHLLRVTSRDPVIMATLRVKEQAFGFLAIVGAGLGEGDLQAVTAFANQVSIALENSALIDELRLSEAYFRSLIEKSSDVITLSDKSGKFLYISPAIQSALGYTPDELMGMDPFELMHPEDIPSLTKMFTELLEQPLGTPSQAEFRMRHKDGRWRTAESAGRIILDRQGQECILVNSHDISARVAAEQELQKQRDFLDSIFKGADLGIFVLDVDPQGEVRYAGINPVLERATGMRSEMVVGKTHQELVPEFLNAESARMYTANNQYCLEMGEIVTFEDREIMDGKPIWWFTRLVPLFDEEGQIYRIIGTAMNITEHKLAERELQGQREFLDSIYQGIDLGIFILDVDAEGELRYAGLNPTLERATGLKSEEVLGKTALELAPDLLDAEIAAYFYANNMRCLQSGKAIAFEDQTRLNGETIYWFTRQVPLFDDEGKIYRIIGTAMEITERKAVERELHEQREFLDSVYQGIDLGIFILNVDTEGELRYAGLNPAMQRATGAKSEEVLGKTPLELTPDLLDAGTAMKFHISSQRCLQARKAIAFEEQTIHNGEPIWWLTRLAPLFDDEGQITRIIGTAIVITERKLMEEELRRAHDQLEQRVLERTQELRASEQRFSLLFENHQAVMLLIEPLSGDIVDANPAAAAFYGYSVAELCALKIDKINQLPSQEASSRRQGSLEGDQNYYICPHQLANGEIHVVEEYISPIEVQGHELLFSIIHDITERKQVEEALRESEARLHQAVQVSPFPIMIHAEDGEVLLLNKAWIDISGYTHAESPTLKDWNALVYDQERAGDVQKDIHHLFSMGEGLKETERQIITKSGEQRVWYFSSAILGTDSDGRLLMISIANDITERVQDERKLSLFAKELERSNEELNQFTYIVSHDLQEPLRMVNSYMQFLEMDYGTKLDENAHEYIGFAIEGAQHMQNLINGLLDYSRVGTHAKPFAETDMEAVLEKTLNILEQLILENEAKITYDPLPHVVGDETQLAQLLQNLIANAIKFHGEQPPEVHISVLDEEDHWQFCVSDNGVGLDPKDAEQIFVIFQRLHTQADYPGSGIGLAVSKRIVERHAGKIWVESQPSEGASFYFTLPIT